MNKLIFISYIVGLCHAIASFSVASLTGSLILGGVVLFVGLTLFGMGFVYISLKDKPVEVK